MDNVIVPDTGSLKAGAAELSSLGCAALRYAERGVPVFPLHSMDDTGVCTCGGPEKNPKCTPGKHPRYGRGLVEHGHNSATTNLELITQWWRKWPEANIAIPTGRRTGVWVLDVDPRNSGDETYEWLKEEYGLPETTQQQTGGGGRQHLYSWAEHSEPGVEVRNSTGEIGGVKTLGVDVRGEGGYIVVPPSVTAARYRWLDASVSRVEAPEALVEACGKPKPRKSSSKLAQGRKETSEATRKTHAKKPRRHSEEHVDVSLKGPVILEGARNHELTRICGVLHDGRSYENLLASLKRVNHFRCSPPLPTAEVGGIALSISRRPPSGTRAEPPASVTLEYLDAISVAWASQAGVWTGLAGDSADSVMRAALEMARRYGHMIPAGIRVSCSERALTRVAGLGSRNTARKATVALMREGWWSRDTSEAYGTNSGAFVLRLPTVSESASRSPRKADPLVPLTTLFSLPTLIVGHGCAPQNRLLNPTSIVGQGCARTSESRPTVGRRLERDVPTDVRHTAAGYSRLGKRRARIISLLAEAGGELGVSELAERLGVRRVSDLRRRSLQMLHERGIVDLDGNTVTLWPDWRERLEDARIEGDEYGASERQAENHRREHEGFVEARKSRLAKSASDPDPARTDHEPVEATAPDTSGDSDLSEVA